MISLEDCVTDHLFVLVGGNTLPNYVAAHLLAKNNVKQILYLIYSEGTKDQRRALNEALKAHSNTASYQIVEIAIEETNPANIYSVITNQLKNIPKNETTGLHYTGGTKPMAVHAYRAIQDWQKSKPGKACYTYLNARTLHLWIERSDWKGAQSLFVGDKLQVSFQVLLALHKRDELSKAVRTEAIWPNVAQALLTINSPEKLRKAWLTPWNPYKSFEEKHESKLKEALAPIRTDELHTDAHIQATVYTRLSEETGISFPTTFGNIIDSSPFAKIANPYYEAVKWFASGWFEDYIFLQLEQLATQYGLHDLALNVKPKIGNKDFEFDVVAMRHYQLFAFSCTLDRGETTCKQKLLEAVARAQQLGGAEARIALVCCIDDMSKIENLQNEVEMLVSDKQVRVFGQRNLKNLGDKIAEWFKELDRISSAS